MFKDLRSLIGADERARTASLIFLMFIGSLLELLGISLIVAVCGMIVNAHDLLSTIESSWLRDLLPIHGESELVIALLASVIIVYVAKGFYLSFLAFLQKRFTARCYQNVCSKTFSKILSWPYDRLASTKKVDINQYLHHDANVFLTSLNAYLNLISEGLVVICLVVFLIAISPAMTLFCIVSIGLSLLVSRAYMRRKMDSIGEATPELKKERNGILNNAVSGYEVTKSMRAEGFFLKRFEEANLDYTEAMQQKRMWPRISMVFIETVVILSILVYLLVVAIMGTDLVMVLPALSGLTLGAIRLIPACNRIGSCLNELDYGRSSLDHLATLLNEPTQKLAHGSSESGSAGDAFDPDPSLRIELHDVTYAYEGSAEPVLRDASMVVEPGSFIGITGPSGAGKTTLLDLLLGFFEPIAGYIAIAGKDIHNGFGEHLDGIAYIPQSVYVLEGSVRENVAFGIEPGSIDDGKVWKALEDAALGDRVRMMDGGLDTELGAKGVKLSGGEKKRLGIARAIYRNKPIVIFDEATSALDKETEGSVMRSIEALKGHKTVIMITHHEHDLALCDAIYEVRDGGLEMLQGHTREGAA